MADNCARADRDDLFKFDRNVERLARVFPNVIPSGLDNKIAVSVMGKAWVENALRFEQETHAQNAPIHDAMLRFNAARAARIAELNKEKVTQWLAGDAVSLGRDVPMMLRDKRRSIANITRRARAVTGCDQTNLIRGVTPRGWQSMAPQWRTAPRGGV